jgi:hypothetical protein
VNGNYHSPQISIVVDENLRLRKGHDDGHGHGHGDGHGVDDRCRTDAFPDDWLMIRIV